MSHWIQDWGTLLSTLALLGVTGWYAWLTRQVSKSAQESATSAKEAARYSQASAAAAVASVPVQFSVSPRYSMDIDDLHGGSDGPMYFGVDVRCRNATVFLHGATLSRAMKPLLPGAHVRIPFADVELTAPAVELPRRVHDGEVVTFELPEERRVKAHVGSLEVIVWYSLDGGELQIPRVVEWYGEKGKDFPEIMRVAPEAQQEWKETADVVERWERKPPAAKERRGSDPPVERQGE